MATNIANELATASVEQNTIALAAMQSSATTSRRIEPPLMTEAELESHSVGTNVERYAVLMIASTTILVLAVLAWFYFYG